MDFHWYECKDLIADTVGLSRPLLHILFGTLIFGAFSLLFPKIKHRQFHALLCVTIIAIANEIADAYEMIRWVGSINTIDTLQDIILTMLVPAIVVAFPAIIRRWKNHSD